MAENSNSSFRGWNYVPAVPIETSPLFTKPLKFINIFRWFVRGWFPLSANLLVLGLALVSWLFFHPALERCAQFEAAWIAQIFLRNLVLMVLVAGGLHLYLYVWKKQGDERHYDSRAFRNKSRTFTFNDQVKDNIFWTCASGVSIWSGFEALMMWAMANNYISVLSWPEHAVWIALLIFLIPIWETFYFYLVHRMLHWPWLYKQVHYLHHKNTNVGPWSGLSMHPVEHLIFLGSVMIHWIVPANPLIIIFHLQYFCLTAATTHCGYQGILVNNRLRLVLGTFHHQMHHRYFECNYGGLEIPWDKWMGSFHDGTEDSHDQFLRRQSTLRKA